MTTQHPITPPPELIQQWWDGTHGAFYEFEAVATQAARWGADQELDACINYVDTHVSGNRARAMREIRRPKPLSLKEYALGLLNEGSVSDLLDSEVEIIRRALEQLPDTLDE
jgi:hypothetical protein